MESKGTIEPVSDLHFRLMEWSLKLTDLLCSARRRLERLPLQEGMAVLDYGCGPGRYTLPVARAVGPRGKVFAVDSHWLAVMGVEERAVEQGLPNVEAILVDSYDTGLPPASIDLILLVDTLHMISDTGALFREFARLLKPDGIVFMDPGRLELSEAVEVVESTGLFEVRQVRGRDMLVGRVAGA